MEHDFQQLVEVFKPMTCVLSVDSYGDNSYGNIRIVAGNQAYARQFSVEFVPNQEYERYIPRDLNFEDFCFRSAIRGETIHTYIHPELYSFWINLTFVPLGIKDGNTYYCLYTQEFTQNADVSLMANLSPATSAAVLKTCIKLRGAEDFQAAVDEVIQDIRDLTDAHHCCILLTDFEQRKCSVLCESLSMDTALLSMKHYVDDDFIDIAATWDDTIGGSTNLLINDARGWELLKERNPVWYQSMHAAGAESLVLFPLKAHGITLGYIWAINFNVEHTVEIKELLELTTFFIASEIANYQLFHRMEVLSSTDLLTGVYNRNAMNNRIDRLLNGEETAEQVGVVFADLNGLKYINDHEGHYAGDLLLKNAALTLQKVFKGCSVYRAGGDEFMVMSVSLTDEELTQCVEKLRQNATNPEMVSFAVGCCTDIVANLRKSMHTADERMYADKKAFYEKNPLWKRD